MPNIWSDVWLQYFIPIIYDFEVIVVNDKHRQFLGHRKKFPCRIIDLETNKGVANARNKGAEFAKGDILIFFDSDVLLEPDTLLRFAKAHENPDVKYTNAKYITNR